MQGNNKRRATAAPIEVTVRTVLGKLLEMRHFVCRLNNLVERSFDMDRRLSRSNTVCRRDWRGRVIVPGAQKCIRTTSEIVVLSGFPTAVAAPLGRLLPGTNAGAQQSDQRARRLLLPRNDILPPLL
jgi:hypothetical protein